MQERGAVGGQLGGGARGPARSPAVAAALPVDVESALDGAWGDAQVGGAVLLRPATRGHEDDLAAVAERAVVGRPEGRLQTLLLGSRQVDTDPER